MLFERFIERGFHDLDGASLDPLALLLEQPDQDIYAWLTAKEVPEQPQLRLIVDKIRQDVGLTAAL